MAYKRLYKQKTDAPENLTREHTSLSGFCWKLIYPERSAAALGTAKPRARITCDGFDPASLPVAVAKALEKQIVSGECSEPESHAELLYDIKELSYKLALQRIADMASHREYSSFEANQRLRRDGYSKASCERALQRAKELGIINDTRFTESFIRSKIYQGLGPVRIERELTQKGIDPSSVEGWPEEYLPKETLQEAASALLATKRIPDKNPYEKLVRYLVARGYSYTVAKSAVSLRLSEYEDELER